jgi:hypothetical protein
VQQQQYLSLSTSSATSGSSTLSRLGSNTRLTTILASSLWIIAGTIDTTEYRTNVAWINGIYFTAMILVGTILIGIANYTGFQLLRAMSPTGLVTDQVSHDRRTKSATQLKRFVWAYNAIYLLVFIGELDNIITYLSDFTMQWRQYPPTDPNGFRYEFDILMVRSL